MDQKDQVPSWLPSWTKQWQDDVSGKALLEPEVPEDLPVLAKGKVRVICKLDETTLLFVATDRISAFDVVMKNVRLSLAPKISSTNLSAAVLQLKHIYP